MKNYCKYLFIGFFVCAASISSLGNIDIDATPSGWVPCPPTVYGNCTSSDYLGATIQMDYWFSNIPENYIRFRVRKCDQTNFTSNGTIYVKDGDVCGIVVDQVGFSSGAGQLDIDVPIDYWLAGSKDFTITLTSSTGDRFNAGTVNIFKECEDYQVSNVQCTSVQLYQNQSNIDASCLIENVGNDMENNQVEFYLSTNTTHSVDDVYLGNEDFDLAGGASETLIEDFDIEPFQTPGGYYIVAIADVDNDDEECQEWNNSSFTFVQVNGSPDLAISSITSNVSQICSNGDIDITYVLENYGEAISPVGVDIEFYLSTNDSYGSSDYHLGTEQSLLVLPGGSQTLSASFTNIPVAASDYHIIARIDVNNDLLEQNDYNNTFVTSYEIDILGTVPLFFPADNSTTATMTPLLDWGSVSNANAYAVVVVDPFNNIVVAENTGSSTQYQTLSGELTPDTNYDWVAGAILPDGTICESFEWEFFTPSIDEVNITSPTSSDVFTSGDNMQVVWTIQGAIGPLSFELRDAAGGFITVIEENVASSQGAITDYFLPICQVSGQYKIKAYETGTGNFETESPLFTINQAVNCDCDITVPSTANGDDQELVDAANFLCNAGYINSGDTRPTDQITRGELAKIVFLALFESEVVVPSDNFPSPFLDLQDINAWYYRYGKCLSYLEYDDGSSPYSRNIGLKFRPDDNISRANTLKVILESFDITEDGLLYNPFNDVDFLTDSYSHIVSAFDLCLIGENGGLFNPTDPILRGDVFLIMYRLLSAPCATDNYTKPSPILTDYYCPGNQSTYNFSREIGISEGNFNHYMQTSFSFSGVGLPLDFTHQYSSYITDLPDGFIALEPMGKGWSHSYNSYISEISIWDQSTGQEDDDKLVVFFPSGQIQIWDDPGGTYPYTCTSDTKGVYDTLKMISATEIEIKSKSQHVYSYSKLSVGLDKEAFLISKIVDRNQHAINITYEDGHGAGTPKRIAEVVRELGNAKTSERTLHFNYQTSTNYISEVYLNIPNLTGTSISFTVNSDGDLKTYSDRMDALTIYNYIKDISSPTEIEYEKKKHLLYNLVLPKGNTITNTYSKRKLNSTSTNNKLITNINTSFNYELANQGVAADIVTNNSELNANTYEESIQFDSSNEGKTECITINGDSQCLEYNDNRHPFHPTKISDANGGLDVFYSYDTVANLTQKEFHLNSGEVYVHQFEYNQYNDLEKYTDPSFNSIDYSFGSNPELGQVESIADQSNFMTMFDYYQQTDGLWKAGALKDIETAMGISTSFTVDEYGNANGVQHSSNISMSSIFDGLGREIQYTTANDNTYQFMYLDNGLQHKTINPKLDTIEYGYDLNYNLTSIINERGFVTYIEYDDDTDLLESVSFESNVLSYNYYSDGRIDEITKPDNSVIDIQYVSTGNGLGKVSSNGFASHTYDNENRLLSTTKTNSSYSNTLSYTYDALDRVIACTYGQSGSNSFTYSVFYDYDPNGNVSTIQYPNFGGTGTLEVQYRYYPNNWLKEIEDWEGKVTYFYYHADGNVDHVINPNNTSCIYAYDPLTRRLNGKTELKSNGEVISQYTYELDDHGNIISETRLDPLSNTRYESSLTTLTYLDNNFIDQVNGVQYQFNANGNLIYDGKHTYNWDDSYDILEEIDNGSTTYKYDGYGNRRERTIDGTTTRYALDVLGMSTVFAQLDESNNSACYYIYAGSNLLYRKKVVEGHLEDSQYHYNFQGSTVAISDESQNITHKYAYSPYGQVISEEESDANPFKFNGRYGVMSETDNLYYMRARYYDAELGRFISQDPIWSSNLFAFGNGNPKMNIDPAGLYSIDSWQYSLNEKLIYAGEAYLSAAHVGLDVIGLVPGVGEVADGGNALIYAAEGDFTNASLSTAAMIPIGGQGVTVAKHADKYHELVKIAQKKYPKKAGKIEKHHITPKYLGGAENGPLVPIDAAYHQQITNEFRTLWKYNQEIPSKSQLAEIMKKVYSKYPLPSGFSY